jgi:cholest-4-en-3-one 26-monooxygenase
MAGTDLDAIDIISHDTYAEHGYPHAAWTRLRREAPIWWNTSHVVNPFWAVTRHRDILEISKQPELFHNGPRLAVFPEFNPPAEDERVLRHLLNMDPPDHAAYRKLVSHRFTPRGLGRMTSDIEAIARALLDEMAGDGGERKGDFVAQLSAPLPLNVLAELLGVPREMWNTLFRWTNEIAGATDPEYQREGEGAVETSRRARVQLFEYFAAMTAERRTRPRDDIVSAIANAELRGAPLPPMELLSYYFLLVVAGNETTRNAMTGGLLALIENPGELRKLSREPSLVDSAVEEIVRWTTPVIQFCRTPIRDVEIRGQKIRAGESLCLFYPSANRDEEVFEAPFEFRVDRQPNRHLAFGVGEHFCLGANLARLELRVVFRQLVARLEHVELAGKPERLRSSFLGGIKRMGIRYRMKPA